MTTLHRVSEVTKKIGIGFGIGILSLSFIFITFRFIAIVRQSLFPTPPPPPTVSFGKLPKIIFPASATALPQMTVTTVTGSFPILGDRIAVYKLLQPQVSFSSLDNAKAIAAKNNFLGNPTVISDTVYKWDNTSPANESLSLNIQTLDFLYTSDYLTNPEVLGATNLGNPTDAIITATNFISTFETDLPDDIDQAKTNTSLFTIQNNTLVPASSLSTAQIIRVDYYQKDINKIPIYYPHYPQSIMSIFVGSKNADQSVVAATYIHKTIDQLSSGTYPIKTAQQAFDELKQGNGFIAQYDTPEKPAIVRNISLGYYLSDDTSQQYLMPIIVFQGDNNFFGFVSAVMDGWIQK
jgi:hypothetical protein